MRERSERRYFRDVVEPLLGDGAEYVGEAGPEQKLRLLRRASCLLNPIDWEEPFGLVMVESMMCGTPVVATPRGSAPELVADGITGFVRPTAEAMTEAMRRASRLDRARVRASAMERFDSERMVGAHADLYRRLIEGHRPQRAA
jgi:glycosyltransferase involved in cell wall biosynthesis